MDGYSGVRWSAISKYGAQGTQFIISMVMARLLAPEYFGLLGMAVVITGFVSIFRNLGFSQAIVQRKEVSERLLSTLFWVNLGMCLLIAMIVLAISPLAAWIYDDARVTPIVAALSLSFVFAGFTMIPGALLTRQMDFKRLAIREIGGIVVSGVTAISLAYLGWGVWALVISSLANSAAQMVLINIAKPFRPQMVYDSQGLSECLRFGLNLTGFGVFNYFSRNADNLIIGVFLGPIALGYYSLAYKLMLMPRDSVTGVVTRVLFPKFSRLQDDDETLTNLYLRACGAIAFITFPMMAGLAVLAEPFVRTVLGEKWLPAIPLIWLLAPVGAIQSIGSTSGQIFLAKGRSGWMFRLGILNGSVRILSFLLGIPWGVVGVASSYTIISFVLIPSNFWFMCKLVDGLTIKSILKTLQPYTTASLLMGSTVALGLRLVPANDFPAVALSTSIAIGVVSYALIVIKTRPPAIDDFWRMLPSGVARLPILRMLRVS
ncbi:MOP flippase family protein [Roseiconus lacunae]|uniref:MOP flippase family protein n=1 Tax=Roseiconus lacunae TaxID=2605694 RepID=UPI003088F0F2|nr:MOP flippase family protein [Stieleria sp. HD01]